MTPSILLLYPSCFYYPNWMERIPVKTSHVLLGSYLAQFFPVRYEDLEISIGRANSAVQVRRFERRVREILAAETADILAISCWTSLSWQATMVVARIFRELHPSKLIVVGGYHPSARPDDFVTPDNIIDYVISGEGELALTDIARAYPRQGRPARTTVVRAPVLQPEQFVPYNWELIADSAKQNFPNGLAEFCIYLSRGCPFSCSFCMEHVKDGRWRAYSPEQAVHELQRAVDLFNLNGIGIGDACFGMRPGWRKEFLKRLVATKPSYWVVLETRPEYLDDEDIALLAQLKTEVQLGIESCSPRMLLLMRKTRQPEKFLTSFRDLSRRLNDHGVLHRANLIFNHPGETRESLNETFAFMDRELTSGNSYCIWAPHGYMHFPGCELDLNRPYYEQTFGSTFAKPDWWREDADQYANSMACIPSADLSNGNTQLWETLLAERADAMKAALAPAAFRLAALKYNAEWQGDPRFKQV